MCFINYNMSEKNCQQRRVIFLTPVAACDIMYGIMYVSYDNVYFLHLHTAYRKQENNVLPAGMRARGYKVIIIMCANTVKNGTFKQIATA